MVRVAERSDSNQGADYIAILLSLIMWFPEIKEDNITKQTKNGNVAWFECDLWIYYNKIIPVLFCTEPELFFSMTEKNFFLGKTLVVKS